MATGNRMIICPVCGASNDANATECAECGADLSMVEAMQEPPAPTPTGKPTYVSGAEMADYMSNARGPHAGYTPSSAYTEQSTPYTSSAAYAQSLYAESAAQTAKDAQEMLRTGHRPAPARKARPGVTITRDEDTGKWTIDRKLLLTRILPAVLVVLIVLAIGLVHVRNTHRYPVGSWSIAQDGGGESVAFTVESDGGISIRYGEATVPGTLEWTNPGPFGGIFAFGPHDYALDWGAVGAIAQQYGVTSLPAMTLTTPYGGFTGRWALTIDYEGMEFSFDARVMRGGQVTVMGSSAGDSYGSSSGTWTLTGEDSEGATYAIDVEGSAWTVHVPSRFS